MGRPPKQPKETPNAAQQEIKPVGTGKIILTAEVSKEQLAQIEHICAQWGISTDEWLYQIITDSL